MLRRAVSKHGVLAYVRQSLARPVRELTWFDRAGLATPLTRELRRYSSVALSPDAQTLALTIRGEGPITFSPDGRFVVYQSNETGRPEVYAQSLTEPGERVQISADGGTDPVWAGNGEILFRRDERLLVASPSGSGGLDFQASRVLFSAGIVSSRVSGVEGRVFDVTGDGQRILAITSPLSSRPRQIEVVVDWLAQLERLAPAQ